MTKIAQQKARNGRCCNERSGQPAPNCVAARYTNSQTLFSLLENLPHKGKQQTLFDESEALAGDGR
jgi:hypothetical protein